MLFYYLKCKKKYRTHKPKEFQKLVRIKERYHQNVLYVVVKNQNLLRNKKQVEY